MTDTDARMELKSCPFCGGEAEFVRRGTNRQSSIVACQECGARVETGETWNEGQLWNTRHSPASEGVREAKLAYETARHIIGHLATNCGLSFIDVTQDDWDAIKRLIAAPSEAGGWMPIETAPRSWDAPILARNSRLPMCPPVVVRWSEKGISGELPDPHWCDAATPDGMALYFNSNYFDYWMPVPAPYKPGRER